MTKKIITVIVLVTLIGLSYFLYQNKIKTGSGFDFAILKKGCEEHNGEWLSEYKECEFSDIKWCESVGGKYYECESACRHNPNAEICTMQCVMVCKFNEKKSNLNKKQNPDEKKISEKQTITSKSWKWVKTQMNNDETIIPNKKEVFSVNFTEDNKINGTTDCNNFFGTYEITKNKISIGPLATTRKHCEDSQENIFLKYLGDVSSYFLDNEKLILEIKMDSGVMIFE